MFFSFLIYVYFNQYVQQLVDISEGRLKTDEVLFLELKICKSRIVFESVNLKNIKNKIPEEWKMDITSLKKMILGEI